MSKRTSERSLPKRNSARQRATSVFPTPVGPRNRKLPTGRFGFFSPARDRRMARADAEIARSWLMRPSVELFLDPQQLLELLSWRLVGMPVQRATTSWMSFLPFHEGLLIERILADPQPLFFLDEALCAIGVVVGQRLFTSSGKDVEAALDLRRARSAWRLRAADRARQPRR